MKKVEFIKDFAGKKKGDTASYDSILASELVNIQKVAKYAKSSSPDKYK